MKNIDLFQNAAWNWFPLQCRFEFVTTYSRSSVACVDSFNFGFSLNNVAIKSGTNLSAFIYTKDLIVRVTYAESGGTLGFIHPNLNNFYLLKLLSREFPRTSSRQLVTLRSLGRVLRNLWGRYQEEVSYLCNSILWRKFARDWGMQCSFLLR